MHKKQILTLFTVAIIPCFSLWGMEIDEKEIDPLKRGSTKQVDKYENCAKMMERNHILTKACSLQVLEKHLATTDIGINATSWPNNTTALHIVEGEEKTALLLEQPGIDVNALTVLGRTPLEYTLLIQPTAYGKVAKLIRKGATISKEAQRRIDKDPNFANHLESLKNDTK